MKLQIDTNNLHELQIIRNSDNTFDIHYVSIMKERTYLKGYVKYSTLERETANAENIDINCIEIEYEERANTYTKSEVETV